MHRALIFALPIAPFELLRMGVVCTCALALIAAGHTFPTLPL